MSTETSVEAAALTPAEERNSETVRQMVASRPDGVHLKIDAARLGRLVAEGESALRCLGCDLIVDGEGRSYVIYPATAVRH